MPKYNYVAMDARGKETKGTLEVSNQNEAIGRIRDMGFFPTKVVEDKGGGKSADAGAKKSAKAGGKKGGGALNFQINIPGLSGRVKSKVLTTFTRQLSTLVQAGLPLLRGLRVLQKQEKNANLRGILGELGTAIEGGSTFSEALAQHPKVFNRLFVNMVKAGEIGGVLEVVLRRLSEFMEKAQKIKGKVIAAMFYPCAVITVATGIMAILMIIVIPKFKDVFSGTLTGGKSLPVHPACSGHQRRHPAAHCAHAHHLDGCHHHLSNRHPHQGGPPAVRHVQAENPGAGSGHQQSGHIPIHPDLGDVGEQRRAHSASPDHRQGNIRQRGRGAGSIRRA